MPVKIQAKTPVFSASIFRQILRKHHGLRPEAGLIQPSIAATFVKPVVARRVVRRFQTDQTTAGRFRFQHGHRLPSKTEAAYRQQAQWAKGSAAGAKKDLDSAMEKLRETLTPEEMDALLAQLRSEQAPPKDGESVTEQWRGWGGGI